MHVTGKEIDTLVAQHRRSMPWRSAATVIAVIVGFGCGLWRAIALLAVARGGAGDALVFAGWTLGGMLAAPVLALVLGVVIDLVTAKR